MRGSERGTGECGQRHHYGGGLQRKMYAADSISKGLFQVRGDVLIEREIRQLKEAGIEDIIVVVGFKHEQFEYLREKFGVTLLLNEDYDKYNNMSSLYVAQDYMRNSYILCSDHYYEDNVFHQYLYTSYYSCVYSEKFCDEYCVTDVDDDGYITGIHRPEAVFVCVLRGGIWPARRRHGRLYRGLLRHDGTVQSEELLS